MVDYTKNGLSGDGVEIYSISGFSLSTTATDTYVNSSNLITTGTYALSIEVTNSPYYSETWSGIMQWYSGSTNSNDSTGITLTGMGHAPNGKVVSARVKRKGGNQHNHSLQVFHNSGTNTVNMKIYAVQLNTQ